jgi:hypothetical protein
MVCWPTRPNNDADVRNWLETPTRVGGTTCPPMALHLHRPQISTTRGGLVVLRIVRPPFSPTQPDQPVPVYPTRRARQDDNHLRAPSCIPTRHQAEPDCGTLDLQVDPVVLTGLTRLTGLGSNTKTSGRTDLLRTFCHALARSEVGPYPLCRDIEPVVSDFCAPAAGAPGADTSDTNILGLTDHPGSRTDDRAMAPLCSDSSQLAKVCLGVHLSRCRDSREMNAIAGVTSSGIFRVCNRHGYTCI